MRTEERRCWCFEALEMALFNEVYLLITIVPDKTEIDIFGAKRQIIAAHLSSLSLENSGEAANLGVIIDGDLHSKSQSITSQNLMKKFELDRVAIEVRRTRHTMQKKVLNLVKGNQ